MVAVVADTTIAVAADCTEAAAADSMVTVAQRGELVALVADTTIHTATTAGGNEIFISGLEEPTTNTSRTTCKKRSI